MSVILIVEDNEKNLKLVRDILQVKGYRDDRGRDGEDGLRARPRAASRTSCSWTSSCRA